MEKQAVIVCMAVSSGIQPRPSAKIGKCCDCNCSIYYDADQQLPAGLIYRYQCISCALSDGGLNNIQLTPQQLETLRKRSMN